jgi:peroxiredoxin
MGPGPVTYLATSMFSPDEEFAFLDSLGHVFEARCPKAGFTRKLSRFLEKPRMLAPGKTAPDFSVTDPAGKPVSLSRFRGSWVLLDFWASWCKPCRAENPNLVQAYSKYKDKGFTIFSVSLDGEREAWMKAMIQDRMLWAHGSELKGWKSEVAVLYGLNSIPASFLLDPEGRIVAKNLRGAALAEILALRIR